MTKQNDRLATLETVIKEVDRKIDAMFDKFDKLCDLEQGPIAKQGKKIERHDTLLTVLFSIFTPLIVGIIIFMLKSGTRH